MHLLAVQVQPDLAPGLDMEALTKAFTVVAANKALVIEHSFENGDDEGPYYNFTFSTKQVAPLWQHIQNAIFNREEFMDDLNCSAQVACTGRDGWNDCLLLFHFDPDEPLDHLPAS